MKKITEKTLAMLISAHILFGPMTAFAEGEEKEAAQQPTAPVIDASAKTAQTEPEYKAVDASQSALAALVMRQYAMEAAAADGDDDGLAAENAANYKKRKARQQENQTSANDSSSFVLGGIGGKTVMRNKCNEDCTPSAACPNPTGWIYQNITNSNGSVMNSGGTYSCATPYITSDGSSLNYDEIGDFITKEALVKGELSNVEAGEQVLRKSLLSEKQQNESRIYSAIMDWMRPKIFDAASYAEEKQKEQQEKIDRQDAMVSKIQKDRGVLSEVLGDAPYKIRLSPTVPAIDDVHDVTITLIPKDQKSTKRANGESKYEITIKYVSQYNGKTTLLTGEENGIVENNPITLEKAEWGRVPGTREVVIICKDKDTNINKVSRFSYTVSQPISVLSADGKVVHNSVYAAKMNADIYASSTESFAVAGKIMNAIWDGARNTCIVTVADDNIQNGGDQVEIETSKLSAEKCKNAPGTYMSMSSVSAEMNEATGKITFSDRGGDSNQSMFGKTREDFLGWQNESNKALKEVRGGVDPLVYQHVQVDNVDGYVFGNWGSPGSDYTILPNGVTIGVQYDETSKHWYFLKPDGSRYSDAELWKKANDSGLDLASVTFDDNNTEKCVIYSNDSVVNRDYFVSSDLMKSMDTIYTVNSERLKNGFNVSQMMVSTLGNMASVVGI